MLKVGILQIDTGIF